MAFAEGFERGGRMAQGIIGTYRDANQRARERAAEEEIAALNAQYARSGEMIEAPPPRTGLRPDLVSGALPVNINRMQPTPAAGLGPTPAPAQQPVQQMLRQVATPASGGLTARMNTEAAAVAERPVRATPTPPAQSQIYQQQADVYSRYGLTDQARRTRDLGLGAARDEERMRVDEERYQTGLEFQQSAEERAQAREARETAADEYTQAQRKATDEAFAALAAGGNLDELMARPSVDQMALLQFAATRGNLRDQEAARVRLAAIDDGTAAVSKFFSENGTMPTYQDLEGIAAEREITVAALMGPALEAAGYTKEIAINYAAGVRQAINGAGNITAANKVLKDSIGGLLDPNPNDDIYPEFVEIDLDTGELKPGSGAWTVKYGDNILPEAGVFRGRPGLPGWKLMLTQLGEQFDPDGDPIGMYARIQGIFPDAEPPLTFDSKDYIAVFKQLSERERPLTKMVEGEEVALTPEELWQEAGRIIRGEVDPGLPGLDEVIQPPPPPPPPPVGLRPQAGAVTPQGAALAPSVGQTIQEGIREAIRPPTALSAVNQIGAQETQNTMAAEAVKRKIASGNLRAAGFFERNQYQAALNSGILTPEEAAEVRFALGQTTPE
jgi:hypothetical protein